MEAVHFMLKWVLFVGGLLVVFAVVVLAALPWLLDTPGFKTYVAHAAAHAIGRPVKFASLTIAPFPLPTVKLRGLEVADDPAFGPGPFLTVSEGRLGIRLKPLFLGRIELANLVLDEPMITLVEDEGGRANWASVGAVASAPAGTSRSRRIGAASPASVLLSRISIVNGHLNYRKLGAKGADFGLEQVNVTVSQAAPRGALQMQGDGTVRPGNVRLSIREATLTPSARGLSEMALHGTVDVEARDIASLTAAFLDAPALAGAMKGRLEVSGTLARVSATGVLGFEGMTVTDDRPRCNPRRRQLPVNDLRVPILYSRQQLDSGPVDARLANGTVTLRVSVSMSSSPLVTLRDIAVKHLELGPILGEFLCQPYAVMGPLDLTGDATMRARDPRHTATGSARFKIGPGAVTGRDVVRLVNEVLALADADATVLSSERRMRETAPLQFESITGSFTIVAGVVRTNDLLYQGPDLRVAARGTVALADGRVDMAVVANQGRNEVRGMVSGTTEALRVVPSGLRIPDSHGARRFLNTLYR